MKASVHPPNNGLSESEAILLAQQGDAAAFEDLYRLHSRRVFALCLRMSVDRSEAEDLTQETFLTIFRKIQSFRGESAFSTWVHRVTVNTVLMRFRKKNIASDSLDEPNDWDENGSKNAPAIGRAGPAIERNDRPGEFGARDCPTRTGLQDDVSFARCGGLPP